MPIPLRAASRSWALLFPPPVLRGRAGRGFGREIRTIRHSSRPKELPHLNAANELRLLVTLRRKQNVRASTPWILRLDVIRIAIDRVPCPSNRRIKEPFDRSILPPPGVWTVW